MKGGAGAAEYAQSVYGGIGEQHAANNYSNVIAMTNLAVPAVLLIANQAMTKRRRSTSHKRRSHRRR